MVRRSSRDAAGASAWTSARFLIGAAPMCAALATTTSAEARVDIAPRLELRQVFDDGLDNEFRTYTVINPGVTVTFDSRRVQGAIEYGLNYRAKEAGQLDDKLTHTALARVTGEVIRDAFYISGGGLMTKINRDLRGPIRFNRDSDSANLSDLMNGFINPYIDKQITRDLHFTAGYTFSITDVNDSDRALNAVTLGGQDFGLRDIQDSVRHAANIGIDGKLLGDRLIWGLRGDYSRDRRGQLRDIYKVMQGALSLEYVVNRKFSLLGSGGYEHNYNEQDSLRRDVLGNLLDPNGAIINATNYPNITVTEAYRLAANGRRRNYDISGATWDAGFRYRPSRRTEIMARGGRQFGGTAINVTGRYKMSERTTLALGYQENVDTFGGLLTQQIGNTSTSYALSGRFNTGSSFLITTDANGIPIPIGIQSINDATFKIRRASVGLQYQTKRNSLDIAAFFDERRLLDYVPLPFQPIQPNPSFLNSKDRSIGISVDANHQIDGHQSVSAGLLYSNLRFALSRNRHDDIVNAYVGYQLDVTKNITGYSNLSFTKRWSTFAGQSESSPTFVVGLRARF